MIQPDECGAEVGRALAGAQSRAGQAFTEQRDRLKHILGNLTLLASRLNPALSRSPWGVKKAELLRSGQSGLSRELHALEDWAEREILARGEVLAEVACGVWRYQVGAVS
ncbi:HNH endonuclease family protein [Pseudomonas stutzeri]|nr:HNH endonuclease family protein [Stutzerimonas stutzeri]